MVLDIYKILRNLNIILLGVFLLLAFPGLAFPKELDSVCEEFSFFLRKPAGLAMFSLEEILDDQGKQRIPNVDVDGDGLIDVVYWLCPNQGSAVPSDPCEMSIEFSSGKKINFVNFGFRLIRYKEKIYAITAEYGRNRTAGSGEAFRIDKSGVRSVCQKL